MKILLTGASGQVGHELARSLRPLGELAAPGHAECDLADLDQLRAVLRAVRPNLIVNAAAYTAVDRAEGEGALAMRINADAPALMAQEARALGAALLHYSTDYVFDGSSAGAYAETDTPAPLNVYGRSKLAGEQAIAAAGIPHLILRTSWLYGMHGNNFLLTMLRLARERPQLRIVADQHGAPTWSRTVADTSAQLLGLALAGGAPWWERHGGLYHLGSQGETSWAGFAEAIFAATGTACQVIPISAAEYGASAPRPPNSRLNCARLMALCGPLPHWRAALADCLAGAGASGAVGQE
ncbi:dTDP-4-dehydrorhamnose reductase [Massilia antarctica]|uniref:dTDP-4-dehydrorhamnose reductase n=1 Tax=Massilia antarctica TaxID=2765360 RepID=UPI0006BB7757|nr:dTDP-4-dehydrorhamnose reductase [Massilia sp. H27-R4]CUI09733.1 dTDP-4-dehydrorhamnose reductase [Janthinobacterium sp. CG23_2]CUU33519.1 dTDP-4-dehydrorhamnose reductase [Janthinobacterium sp. CG23_2]